MVDDFLYGKLVGLKLAGKSNHEIAAALNIGRSTVIRQLKHEQPPSRRQKGRPPLPVLNCARRRFVRRLVEEVVKDKKTGEPHPRYPTRNSLRRALWCKHKIAASECTVGRDLKALGFKCYVRRFGPMRKEGDRAKRVAQSKAYLRRGEALVKRLSFSDETTFRIQAQSTCCRTMYATNPRNVMPRPKEEWVAKKDTCHFWGVIGPDFKLLLPITPGKLKAEQYKTQCLHKLAAILQERGVKQLILMQDGDRSHGTAKNIAYLKSKSIEVLQEWPARSPDLNPIENWWAILKRRVAARGPQNTKALQQFILEEAEKTTMEEINAMVSSFPRRLKECIRVQGATIITKECGEIHRNLEKQARKRPRD